MACIKRILCVAVLLASTMMLVDAQGSDNNPCTNGSLCCRDCTSRCPGVLLCFTACKSPCVNAISCVSVGNQVARGVAAAACDIVKSECGILPFAAAAAASSRVPTVDLKTCCKIVRGSCQGTAERIPCTVNNNNYGSCSKFTFEQKYSQKASSICKSAVCNNSVCRNELTSNDGC